MYPVLPLSTPSGPAHLLIEPVAVGYVEDVAPRLARIDPNPFADGGLQETRHAHDERLAVHGNDQVGGVAERLDEPDRT
jgi:hypothetical protein